MKTEYDRKQTKDHCYLLHIGMLFIIQPSHRQETM